MKELREDDSDTLLPCPFCGGKPRHEKASYVTEHNSWFPEFVECQRCRIGFYSKHGAIKAWNTREDTAIRNATLDEVQTGIDNMETYNDSHLDDRVTKSAIGEVIDNLRGNDE